ncbi:hypothetical protein D3OALGA1CA_2918 [Olavius algarvensis associated proteobacterium Delta 3]|nr:hypothetical protein D3OALGB2SA_2751 [Olavius algarvensis associated proteobacterium Delta 3]CAB5126222.1 hypothetical protein D3OALGA1CA_2918 [Olavius algarvensis associated proteobacterium Delta 3]
MNTQERNTLKMRRWTVLLTIMVVAGYLLTPAAFAEEKAATMEVIGTARLMFEPNMAVLSFAVETNARSAGDAVAANAVKTRKLIETVKGVAGTKDSVKTSHYDLSPVYSKTNRFRPEGYRVSNRVIVETRALDKVGRLIDAAVGADVSRIGSLRFQNDQYEFNRKAASKAAVQNALVSARELAEAAGLTLRRIVTISFTGQGAIPRPYMAEAAVSRAQTPIEAGRIPVEARVTVVFEVE